jgi:hypothetical protein
MILFANSVSIEFLPEGLKKVLFFNVQKHAFLGLVFMIWNAEF